MKKHLRSGGTFRWESVEVKKYKKEDASFRDITRQLLLEDPNDLACQVRYFEIAPGGWSTLEKHDHVHVVFVVQGEGKAVVGNELLDLGVHDLVHVPPITWHQFLAPEDRPLGFLCIVRSDRDRPVRPTEEDLALLKSDPAIGPHIR